MPLRWITEVRTDVMELTILGREKSKGDILACKKARTFSIEKWLQLWQR